MIKTFDFLLGKFIYYVGILSYLLFLPTTLKTSTRHMYKKYALKWQVEDVL